MAKRRKPISFDTTLRNPQRIPQFVSILDNYVGQILDSETIYIILAEFIKAKIYEPTKSTMGTYIRSYTGKFNFTPDDLSNEAPKKVESYFKEWLESEPGTYSVDKIVYMLKNTTTKHKEAGWEGGWESRFDTQFKFIRELGFVYLKKDEPIKISDTGKLLIKHYSDGIPDEENFSIAPEATAYLNGFSKYQTNNPYRKNKININFFPLVLNVIKYMDDVYGKNGISRQDLSFIICWGDNSYDKLAEYIYEFRRKKGYNTSDEVVYQYALGLIEQSKNSLVVREATSSYQVEKNLDYKFSKIMRETPDEVIRKLRQSQLISLKGGGRFIDINKNELDKVNYISNKYMVNINFNENEEMYFDYMGALDLNLIFKEDEPETLEELTVKEAALLSWANDNDWDFLKEQITTGLKQTSHPILRLMTPPTRLEFLCAIIIKKAIPHATVQANYKADDQGIPYNTASGASSKSIGADIDVFENSIHAIVEPSVATSRSMQIDHELPSIRNHLINTKKKEKEESQFDDWFVIFITPYMTSDVGDQVPVYKIINDIDIYPWNADDFVGFSVDVKSLTDFKVIRDYVKPQKI